MSHCAVIDVIKVFKNTNTIPVHAPYFFEKLNTTDSFGGILDLHTCKVHYSIVDQTFFKQALDNLVPVRGRNFEHTKNAEEQRYDKEEYIDEQKQCRRATVYGFASRQKKPTKYSGERIVLSSKLNL